MAVDVPTIGTSAGRHVARQVSVISDVLGLGGESAALSTQYADLDSDIRNVVERDVSDVQSGTVPAEVICYQPLDE